MVQRVYEFDVHLIINGQMEKGLQTIRFISDNYSAAACRLKQHIEGIDNVQLIDYYFIQDYNVWGDTVGRYNN